MALAGGKASITEAPPRYLQDRYRDEIGLPARQLVHLDYGFDLAWLRGRARNLGEPFVFGYIGTHIPAKGIHDLIRAFGAVAGESRLRIWGRPFGQNTQALKALARSLPGGQAERVEWPHEHRNADIVRDLFDRVDAIVVPSVWVENSPLVIHEAQQARVPVIMADPGGMAEYVHHGVNGLRFVHRSWRALAGQTQRLADPPVLRLLRCARRALPSGERLLVVEMVLAEGGATGGLCDLHLLAATGGRERTASEYATLLDRVGFAFDGVRRLQALPAVVVGLAR